VDSKLLAVRSAMETRGGVLWKSGGYGGVGQQEDGFVAALPIFG
jgi:hypothetical protein